MCLLGLVLNQLEGVPLVVCHNREEEVSRRFDASVHTVRDGGVLGAMDLASKGFWAAHNPDTGVSVLITNYRLDSAAIPAESECTSRGELTRWLLCQKKPKLFADCDTLHFGDRKFAGFSVVYCVPLSKCEVACFLISNRSHGQNAAFSTPIEMDTTEGRHHSHLHVRRIARGIHALSNGQFNDTVIWTRLRFLKEALTEFVSEFNSQRATVSVDTETDDECKLDSADTGVAAVSKSASDSPVSERIFAAVSKVMSSTTRFSDSEVPSIERIGSYLSAELRGDGRLRVERDKYMRSLFIPSDHRSVSATISQTIFISTHSSDSLRTSFYHRCTLSRDSDASGSSKKPWVDSSFDSLDWDLITIESSAASHSY